MGRKSLAEVEARRAEVYEMLLQGKPRHFILSYCYTNWGVRMSAVEKDIAAVRQELNKEFQQQKIDIISTHIARYENLYCFYMNEGTDKEPNIHYNPEVASKMLEKKEKLLNLHNPKVVVQTNYQQNNLKLDNITLDELRKLLYETKSLGN
jgi:hypothetical protein